MTRLMWECKHAQFKITYVHFVSLQSSLIKLGNELQQRMQDRRLRGHEHRHMSNNEILILWCKNNLSSCSSTLRTSGYQGLKMLFEKRDFEHWVDNKQEHTFIFAWNVACMEMERQAVHPHLYSLADQNCLQTSPSNCSYSGPDQPLYVVQRTFTYTILNFLWLAATEVNIFSLCCTKNSFYFNLNHRKRNNFFFFTRKQFEGGGPFWSKIYTCDTGHSP